MRVLIATAALQLGSSLVTVRNTEDHLRRHEHLEQVLLEHYLGLGDTATTLKLSREKPVATTHDSLSHCEDAPEGSICFKAVMYLKETGFRKHPDWYPEYNAESLFQDVQAMLNAAGRSDCPIPCASATDQRKEMTTHDEKLEGGGSLAKLAQTSKEMNKIESKPATQDETAAEIEAEMLQAMGIKATEEWEDRVHAKLAQTFKVTNKIESKSAAQDETAAEIEAEMLQAMGDAKAQPKAPTIANFKATEEMDDRVHAKLAQTFKVTNKIEDETAAEIEAEMLQAMGDAKAQPQAPAIANFKATEERGDGVHARMAQRSSDMKKIEGKPAAQNEEAEIEAEMFKVINNIKGKPAAKNEAAEIEAEVMMAMAGSEAGPEISTREGGVHAKMAQRSKEMKNIKGKRAAQDEAADIEAEMLKGMKNIEGRPAAQNEAAEIEAEMLRAIADENLGRRP